MNIDDSNNTDVVKQDMATDYNTKLSMLLSEIDEYKKFMLNDKRAIIPLNERLDALFTKLSPKMGVGDFKQQIRYAKYMARLQIFNVRRRINSYGEFESIIQYNRKNYNKYRWCVMRREVHLNSVMEKLGLTAQHKIKKIRVQ